MVMDMASILVRQLDESIKARLKSRASRHGRSMEEEARAILKEALSTADERSPNIADEIHRRFAALGGIDLPEVPREPIRRPPDFK